MSDQAFKENGEGVLKHLKLEEIEKEMGVSLSLSVLQALGYYKKGERHKDLLSSPYIMFEKKAPPFALRQGAHPRSGEALRANFLHPSAANHSTAAVSRHPNWNLKKIP